MDHSTLSREEKPLSNRQQLAIAEVLANSSLEGARRRLKVSKGAFYGWLKDPRFQAELGRQRAALIGHAVDRLKYGITRAVEKLLELLGEGQPGIELRAAQAILDHGFKAIELQELETRLETLEQAVQRSGSRA